MYGPAVLWAGFVNGLSRSFVLLPALLLSGRQPQEATLRHAGLTARIAATGLEMCWAAVHPAPVPLPLAALAAAVSALVGVGHVCWLWDGRGYGWVGGLGLELLAGLLWLLVRQVGTDHVVRTGRSPARWQILAWLTVMQIGSLVTVWPQLAELRPLLLGIVALPKLTAALTLARAPQAPVGKARSPQADRWYPGPGRHAGPTGLKSGNRPAGPKQALGASLEFMLFACNGSVGEALNHMATDLTIRQALKAGDTRLALAYNAAVTLSMLGGLALESKSVGALRSFAVAWGCCQVGRGVGMQWLSSDRIWLMFVFVFCDKLTGPLGQSAIDSALLSIIKHPAPLGKKSVVPGNTLWTFRNLVSTMERPVCQLALLTLGVARAPAWLASCFALVSVAFVLHTLQPGTDHDADGNELGKDLDPNPKEHDTKKTF